MSPFTIQEPPAQKILLFCRYSVTLEALMPPVGITFREVSAAVIALIIFRPPEGSAGKNFT